MAHSKADGPGVWRCSLIAFGVQHGTNRRKHTDLRPPASSRRRRLALDPVSGHFPREGHDVHDKSGAHEGLWLRFPLDSCSRECRTRIPALPFCHVHLRAQKPLSPAYPSELRTLGDHLRKRRLDLGLLQREVAEQIGVDTTTITNWELGHSSADFRSLPAIVVFLGYDPRPEPRTLGQGLKRHRKGLGMSQKELAGFLGVDPSTLAQWEREDRPPTGQYLQRVRCILGP